MGRGTIERSVSVEAQGEEESATLISRPCYFHDDLPSGTSGCSLILRKNLLLAGSSGSHPGGLYGSSLGNTTLDAIFSGFGR